MSGTRLDETFAKLKTDQLKKKLWDQTIELEGETFKWHDLTIEQLQQLDAELTESLAELTESLTFTKALLGTISQYPDLLRKFTS